MIIEDATIFFLSSPFCYYNQYVYLFSVVFSCGLYLLFDYLYLLCMFKLFVRACSSVETMILVLKVLQFVGKCMMANNIVSSSRTRSNNL